jgi:quercetin dioxygenase-like cupin family protein
MRANPVIVHHHQGEWLSFNGNPVEIIAGGETTGGLFALSRGYAQKNIQTPPHRHGFGEGFYSLSGKQHYRAAGDQATLESGMFIYVPGGVAHQPTCLSEDPAELLVLCVPSGFDTFQRAVGLPIDAQRSQILTERPDSKTRALLAAQAAGIEFGLDDRHFAGPSGLTLYDGRSSESEGVDNEETFLSKEQTEGKMCLWRRVVSSGGNGLIVTQLGHVTGIYVLQGQGKIQNGKQHYDLDQGSYCGLSGEISWTIISTGAQPILFLHWIVVERDGGL